MRKPKTLAPMPSQEQVVAAALNEQGFLFAQLVREKIRNRLYGDTDTQSGWRFIAGDRPLFSLATLWNRWSIIPRR